MIQTEKNHSNLVFKVVFERESLQLKLKCDLTLIISEVLHRADEDEAVELKPAEITEKDKSLPPSNTHNSETAAAGRLSLLQKF